jgi:hypothetical protein
MRKMTFSTLRIRIFRLAKTAVPAKIISLGRLVFFRWKQKRRLQKRKLLQFQVHLTEHCNLKCKYCSHFSPVADKEFIPIDIFERDLARLSELTRGRIEKIALLGGEPLLHPQISLLLDIARKHFNNGLITINTNGTLLLKQADEFWKNCKKNNIDIWITKYPIKLDMEGIKRYSRKFGVRVNYFDKAVKTMWKIPLDMDGGQDGRKNFNSCSQANWCVSLQDGKLFTCGTIPYIRHFNKYFGKKLPVTEYDYIDIHKAKNIGEILEFLCKPVPFCRFCNIENITRDLNWDISKKDISEWV